MSVTVIDPRISFNVVDDSNLTPVEPILTKSCSFLFGLFGSKGDRSFQNYVRGTDLRARLGQDIDDFDLYGQGGVNAVAAIAGGASALACRLLPDDAATAYIIIGITVAAAASIPQYQRLPSGAFNLDSHGAKIPLMTTGASPVAVTAPGLTVGVVRITVTDIGNFDWSPSTVGQLTTYPILAIPCYSDGKFGNNYGLSLTLDKGQDPYVNDGRRYVMSLFEMDDLGNVGTLTNPVYFSLSRNAVLPTNTSVPVNIAAVWPNILTNAEKNPLVLNFYQQNWDALMAVLLPFSGVSVGTSPTIHGIDPFSLTMQNGSDFDTLVRAGSTLDLSDGVWYLTGGTDGSLELGLTVPAPTVGSPTATTVVDKAHIVATQTKLLIDFFNCDYNADLLDRRIVPAGFVLDGAYPLTVKQAIIGLDAYRDDIMRFVDFGSGVSTAKGALAYYEQLITNVNSAAAWNLAFAPHAGVTKDRPTPVRVSQTYELAWDIPATFATFGRYTSVAGSLTGRVKHMSLDWTAQLTKDNIIGQLTTAGLLYCQNIDRSGLPALMSDASQYNEPYSKLSSWVNGAMVGDAMRNAAAILVKYNFYPEGADQAIIDCSKELNGFFLNNAYPNQVKVKVSLYQSANDIIYDSASCDITFYFPGSLKKFTVTVYAKRIDQYTQGAK